jgi:hypothetical protein
MVILIALYFITAPIATTAIARAAYRRPMDRTQELFSYDDMANSDYAQDSILTGAATPGPAAGVQTPPASPHLPTQP